MRQTDEDHPVYNAIDKGGGQVCDIAGIFRELHAAGYVIVPIDPTDKMIEAFYESYPIDCGPIPIWRSMVNGALK
jgi:hypothetical protein